MNCYNSISNYLYTIKGIPAFDSNMGFVGNQILGPTCRCVMFDHIMHSWYLSYREDFQPASEEHPVTPNRPLGMYGAIEHIRHRKPCLGALMCYFETKNRLLIYTLCVIFPIGQRGTPHYSQPATEEWMHLTTLWGTWITSNIENHLGGGGGGGA